MNDLFKNNNGKGLSPTTDQLRLMASFLKDVANGESDICLKNKKKEKNITRVMIIVD